MIADHCSDLHLDSHFIKEIMNKTLTEDMFFKFQRDLNPKGEILLISGDISDRNNVIELYLKGASRLYEHIFFVTGNHELFLLADSKHNYKCNSQNKIDDLKRRVAKIDNVTLLDGDIVDYKGVKIGGAMGWYDGLYSKVQLGKDHNMQEAWSKFKMDSKFTSLEVFDELLEKEYYKLEQIHDKVDIMLTHIPPMYLSEFLDLQFKHHPSTGFYCFNGKNLFSPKIKIWLYGHVHVVKDFVYDGIRFKCNPADYFKGIMLDEIYSMSQIEI